MDGRADRSCENQDPPPAGQPSAFPALDTLELHLVPGLRAYNSNCLEPLSQR